MLRIQVAPGNPAPNFNLNRGCIIPNSCDMIYRVMAVMWGNMDLMQTAMLKYKRTAEMECGFGLQRWDATRGAKIDIHKCNAGMGWKMECRMECKIGIQKSVDAEMGCKNGVQISARGIVVRSATERKN